MVDWGKAFQVFVVGFSGVFACLVILQLSVNIFSKIAVRIEKMGKVNEQEGG